MPATSTPKPRKGLPAWLTPRNLALGLGVVGMAVMVAGTCAVYSTGGPLPPPRPPPLTKTRSPLLAMRFQEGYYRSRVQGDARMAGLKDFTFDTVKQPSPHFAEFSGAQLLKIGHVLETTHLLIKALSQKIWVGEEGQGFRTEHLLLSITNKTDRHLAYRVWTDVEGTGSCSNKGIILHNALALKPSEEMLRTECLQRGVVGVKVLGVEVMEISPMGYFYVSRLDPQRLLYDPRTSEGHQIPVFSPCKLLPWRTIQRVLKKKETRWIDILDFYARHNCDEYAFFDGYRWTDKGHKTLPARPPYADRSR